MSKRKKSSGQVRPRGESIEKFNTKWPENIEREAELPSSVRRNLDAAQKAHEAGNPLGLIDAVIYCNELVDHVPQLTLPRWALSALANEMRAQLREEKLARRMGRHASILEEHRDAHVHYFRYEAVLDAVEHRDELKKLRGGDKFELARQLCEGTPAGQSRGAIKYSFEKVKKELSASSTASKYYLSMYSRYFVPDYSRPLRSQIRSTK